MNNLEFIKVTWRGKDYYPTFRVCVSVEFKWKDETLVGTFQSEDNIFQSEDNPHFFLKEFYGSGDTRRNLASAKYDGLEKELGDSVELQNALLQSFKDLTKKLDISIHKHIIHRRKEIQAHEGPQIQTSATFFYDFNDNNSIEASIYYRNNALEQILITSITGSHEYKGRELLNKFQWKIKEYVVENKDDFS